MSRQATPRDTHDWFGWCCQACGTTADRPEANQTCVPLSAAVIRLEAKPAPAAALVERATPGDRICPGCGCSKVLCLEYKLQGAVACCPDCTHLEAVADRVTAPALLEQKLFDEIEQCATRFEKFMRSAASEGKRGKFDSEESLRNKANEQAIMIIARVRRLRALPSRRETGEKS